MTAPTAADIANLQTVYDNTCISADAHITLDVDDGTGLTPKERAWINLGVDIGWTATLEELADSGLLAGGEPG
jgi:hypothetical protein